MITIKDLKKSFGSTVACDIEQLTIANGEILGLVGNNGAGKTTLFRMLLDLLRPDEGTVSYTFTDAPTDGTAPGPLAAAEPVNPATSEEWKQHTGAYIDEGFLIDYLTPQEYFQFLAKISSITDTDSRLAQYQQFAGEELLAEKKLIRNLSAGNKQKVGIVAALFADPQTVILDEPFNFLDPTSQNQLKHLLTDYHKRTGATLIISSHNLQHTVDISSRIVVLEHGRIVMDGAERQQLEEYFMVGS
jgi:ABC-2 type transport system ATP-binding protein